MNKELLKEYADICNQEKVITARKEELKTKLEEAYGQTAVTEKTDFGTFKMVERTTYTYSEAVTTAQEDLEMAMEDEKEQGIAVPTVAYGLRFNAPSIKK